MRPSYPLRVVILVALALLFALPAAASAARPSFTVQPATALDTPFRWNVSDHALRCEDRPVQLRIRGARGWTASVAGAPPRRGSFSAPIRIKPGVRTTVIFKRGSEARGFHVRCLPPTFPAYEFRRVRPGGPPFIFMQLGGFYAAIFNADGVPVWWFKADGAPYNFQLLRRGRVALIPAEGFTFEVRAWEVFSLGGRLLERVGGRGRGTVDVHELLALGNGNLLMGRRVVRQHVDARPEGPADADVVDIEIQEVTPGGRVVWRWNSADHISTAETGRWWDEPILGFEPYDLVHWNSIAIQGHRALLSFRHLDAVYEIDRRTGDILWKLGGTPTADSLEVRNDPHGSFPLGGQHDARYLRDGSISIFDNRTALAGPPRVVRYRIDRQRGVANLVQAFGDPRVPASVCCGSSRRLRGGNWLVAWGGYPVALVGGYDRRGRRLFSLRTADRFTYRANYATARQLDMQRLRRAMDAVARRGRASG
jgi:arylsulfotransferase ASST